MSTGSTGTCAGIFGNDGTVRIDSDVSLLHCTRYLVVEVSTGGVPGTSTGFWIFWIEDDCHSHAQLWTGMNMCYDIQYLVQLHLFLPYYRLP